MSHLSFSKEFNSLLTHIQASWEGVDLVDFETAAKYAFNQGLHDGRLWIDKFITYRVGELMNGAGEYKSPLTEREKTVDTLYDALCIFDSNLYVALSNIEESQQGFGKWSFRVNTEALLHKVHGLYSLEGVRPIEMSEDAQRALVVSYPGFTGEGIRCNSTPLRLSFADATYMKERQGHSYLQTLVSSIYSHGLACAQECNDGLLSAALKDIYEAFRDLPFSVDAEYIMKMANQHELFSVLHAASPFVFVTQSEFAEAQLKRHEHHARIDAMSTSDKEAYAEQQKLESIALLDEIMGELKAEDANNTIHREREALISERDKRIDAARSQLSVFQI